MIYYFSGTGNSKWVAETLADRTHDSAVNIADISKEENILIKKDSVFGLVFPVYAWNYPEIVSEFLKRVNLEKGAYSYAVCTCGEEAGLVMSVLKARIGICSGFSVVMPNNYIVAGDVDDEDEALKKVREADRLLYSIALSINVREKGRFDVNKGKIAVIKTFAASHFFNKYARSSKPFTTSYDCVGCGLCESVCPTQNIVLADGMPFWDDKCQQCFACIHRCPKRAIDYGKFTKKKGRYYFNYTQEQIKGDQNV